SSEEENSNPRTTSNKCLKKANKNTNSTALPYRHNQNLANNYISTRHINYPRSSNHIDPVLHNLDNITPLNESVNKLQASSLFHNANVEYQSTVTRNFIAPEEQHRNLSRSTTMSLDDISDSQSLTTFSFQQNPYNERISRPDTQFQHASYSPETSRTITNWNSNMNLQNCYNQPKEKISSLNTQLQHTSSSANSYKISTHETDINLHKLSFSDKKSLIDWLCTQPDLIAQVRRLLTTSTYNDKKITPSTDSVSKEFKVLFKKTHEYFDNFRHTFNKDIAALAKDFLVKDCEPSDENIKQFIARKVWRQKLSKYLDASDFSEFKKSSSSLKSLESFVAESLKIHVEYQIAVRNKGKPSYSEDVLAKIKKLNQLTIQVTIASAS
ncbi:16208_t:CDS:2, partial [Cetraspora pellucida]